MVEYGGKNVVIMGCSSCNVKCKHCYIEYQGDICYVELLKMAEHLKKKYNVSLNGSELLLQENYLDVLEYIGQDRVLTNGIIINNNLPLVHMLRYKGIEWVGMSYHFNLHDDISIVKKRIVEENIKLLKENGLKVELMTTISHKNLYDIEQMVIDSINLGADCIRFTNMFREGNARDLDDLILSDDEINIFFDRFYKAKEKYGSSILVRRSGTFSRDLRKINSTFVCPSGENTVAIAPNSKVYPCPFLVKEGYEIGEYVDGKILIDSYYEHNNDTCLLYDVLNKNKCYKKRSLVKNEDNNR